MWLGELDSAAVSAIVTRAWAQAGLTPPPGELDYFAPRLQSGEMDANAVEAVILRQNGTAAAPGPNRAEAIARGARPVGMAGGSLSWLLVAGVAAFFLLKRKRRS